MRRSRRQFLALASAAGVGVACASAAVRLSSWSRALQLPWRATPRDLPLVGYLAPNAAPGDPNVRAFREGLTEQGLVDGRDLHLVLRSADGD